MRSFHNPFRSRASEQQRDTFGFLRYVGAGVLDLLPETVWDRPLIIRSASGGGKTTLMRIFTTDCLLEVSSRREDLPDLAERLCRLEALDATGPTRVGFMLNLRRDYRTLAHSGAPEEISGRLFLRLLDARIAAAAVRAIAAHAGFDAPADAARISFEPQRGDERIDAALRRLGGARGDGILRATRATETEIVDLVDSLLPVDWTSTTRGHAELYSLRLLSDAAIMVDGRPLEATPLLMLDDGHHLAPFQRQALMPCLVDREVTIGRWYAERFEALPTEQMFEDDTPGRDFEILELEREARATGNLGRRRFDRLLHDVGNLRAGRHLERYTRGTRDFFEYLEPPGTDITPDVVQDVRVEAYRIADGQAQYEAWLEAADHGNHFERASRLRAAQIMIERAKNRPQQELFDHLDAPPISLPSDVTAAAKLFLCREHKLAYYAGEDIIVGAATHNVEQFLRICGDLFEFMLGRITLDETPVVTARRQHNLIRQASDEYWRELPARVPNSPDVIAVLNKIAQISISETERVTAPYAPGVNGIAISMEDRDRLLDPSQRARIPGADRLLDALGVAIARNVLVAEPNYSVKNTRVMILYLNRLLCPRLFLPFQRGSFRERGLADVAGWLLEPTTAPLSVADTLFDS